MKNYAYIITMSSGSPLQIDKDELGKVLQAIDTRTACMLRSGIFNPSFYVSVTRDEARMAVFREDMKYLADREEQMKQGPALLKDIFGEEIKQLVEKMSIKKLT